MIQADGWAMEWVAGWGEVCGFATFLAMLPGSVRKSIEITRLKSQVLEYSSKLQKIEKTHSNDIPATTANFQQREELP